MRKLVVLKLDGDLSQGVRVTLEIGEEGLRPNVDISGQLPPNPDMVTAIDQWQSTYRSLGEFTRIKPEKIIYDGSITKRRSDCHNKARELRSHLNTWLQSESFRPIREKWLKHLMLEDEVRVVIRTASMQMKKLPWHLWDLIDQDYRKAEVVLSVPQSDPVPASRTSRNKVRILAILGDSDGINVQQDRQLLEKLPGAATKFLAEPQRQEINDQLWNQRWDILFFAGHSKTENDTGRIYINNTDNLTIAELRYALRNAVAKGLQLAIFNSCDGLGLARELQDLQIPQIIVMREPVPDLVAQVFLKDFLVAFSSGQSLYTAVRTARERLQGLEGEYPGASWLPVICEHPAVAPMSWPSPRIPNFRRLGTLLVSSLLVTASVLGVRYQGGLQTWELQAYDQLMNSRPDSAQDSRLLIVEVTEEDLQLPEQQQKKGSLSNIALERLLEKLTQFQPRAIGLDIYREEEPIQPNQASLATRLKTDDKIFVICKVSDRTENRPGISPPAEVPLERQGFSDVIPDPDGVLRRYLLAMQPADPTSPCTAPYALSALLAFRYLQQEGIYPQYNAQGDLQLGNVVFKRLRSHMGGYQQADTDGYQILLNYRYNRHSPLKIAPTVTLADVLGGKVNPEKVKDRIVLIGTTAQSFRDYITIPYTNQQGFYQEMPGVMVQAQMVSQLVSAVIDGRPLLSVLPVWGDVLWVWGWSVVVGAIALTCRSRLYFVLAVVGALLVLYVLCLVLFIQGLWLPLVPSALVLIVTGGIVVVYLTLNNRLPQISTTLAKKI